VVTDDAEVDQGLWTYAGFSPSTTRAHSGAKSYKARAVNSDVSAMTTVFPLQVGMNTSLSFWCWYNLETNYDVAMVEVSVEGKAYDVLGVYTGMSGDWVFKSFDLSAYAGKSVFIRFRSTTDQGTLQEGFYVDDISQVATYENVSTLSDAIAGTSYSIVGRPLGEYTYRVCGHNERGWCDFSTLQDVWVTGGGGGNDTTPPEVSILRPREGMVYIRDQERFPFRTTLIIGAITVNASATDDVEVASVAFYLDGTLQSTDAEAPYSWTWQGPAFFRHTLRAVATDTSNNTAEVFREVWRFF
jgi:hypothetical protein